MVATQLLVGMAEIEVAKPPAVFTCLGLGSCIGFFAYDPRVQVAGMVHIMLPEAFKERPLDKPGKFADTGIPELLRLMSAQGANTSRLIVAYSGGAQVFRFGANQESKLDIGARNAVATADIVKKMGFRCLAFDVGGSSGRTMVAEMETGVIRVRTVHGGEKVLCNFKH
jgi:chemotaxis protein CheD